MEIYGEGRPSKRRGNSATLPTVEPGSSVTDRSAGRLRPSTSRPLVVEREHGSIAIRALLAVSRTVVVVFDPGIVDPMEPLSRPLGLVSR
jgi:hypothetical protein